MTDFSLALTTGDVEAVEQAIAADPAVVSRKLGFSRPLSIAAVAGQTAVCEVLLRHGSGVDVPDGRGETPLQAACRSLNLDLVRLLLQHGAAPLKRQGDGSTPWATAYGVTEAKKVAVMKLLIELGGVPVDLRGSNKRTMVHDCARSGDVRTALSFASYLLDKEPGLLDAVDSDGCTPVMVADHRHAAPVVIEFFLERGANILHVDNQGRQLFAHLCRRGDDRLTRICQRLVYAGSNVAATWKDSIKSQLVSRSLLMGPTDRIVLRTLIDAGADLEFVAEPSDETPLSVALEERRGRAVLTLLAAGAEPPAAPSWRYTLPLWRLLAAVGATVPPFLVNGVSPEHVEAATAQIHLERLAWLQQRGGEICIALQNLRLPALMSLMILDEAVTPAIFLDFGIKWRVCTAVKHFLKDQL